MKFHKIPFLGLIILFTISCQIHRDPKDILKKAAEKRMEVKSGIFEVIEEFQMSDDVDMDTVKIFFMKDSTDKAYGAKLKVVYPNGRSVYYDGNRYITLDNKKKEAFVVDKEYNPSSFVSRYRQINKVMLKDMKEYMKNLAKAEKIIYEGSSMVDGNECDIVRTENEGVDENSKFITVSYRGKNDGFNWKETQELWANGIRVQYEKSVIKNVTPNYELSPYTFSPIIPQDYKIEHYKPQEEKTSDSESEPEQVSLQVGSMAPDWTLKDASGKDITLSSLKGKVIVLDFWGTWCVWCIVAMPKVQAIKNAFTGKDVVIYGISCREQPTANPAGFIKKKGFNYNVLVKGDSVAKNYGVQGYPTLFVIGKQGQILNVHAGYSPEMDKVIGKIIDKELNPHS